MSCTREQSSRSIIPATVTATDQPTPLVPANEDRRSVLIVNRSTSTANAYIVAGAHGQIGDSSYELIPGEGVSLGTASAVYLCCPTGQTASLKIVSEIGAV